MKSNIRADIISRYSTGFYILIVDPFCTINKGTSKRIVSIKDNFTKWNISAFIGEIKYSLRLSLLVTILLENEGVRD